MFTTHFLLTSVFVYVKFPCNFLSPGHTTKQICSNCFIGFLSFETKIVHTDKQYLLKLPLKQRRTLWREVLLFDLGLNFNKQVCWIRTCSNFIKQLQQTKVGVFSLFTRADYLMKQFQQTVWSDLFDRVARALQNLLRRSCWLGGRQYFKNYQPNVQYLSTRFPILFKQSWASFTAIFTNCICWYLSFFWNSCRAGKSGKFA